MGEDVCYDVAFSFRACDLELADELKSKLDPPMNCFVYARKQEAIAGTDGMETFRNVFRKQSRLNVVLYRQDWGKTPWTGVEEAAIKDACLQTRFHNLVFVRLDTMDVPLWLPETYQTFDRAFYSNAELIGVIKSRVAELGGNIRPQTVAEKVAARNMQAEEALAIQQFLDSEDAVKHARAGFEEFRDQLRLKSNEIAAANPGWSSRFGQGNPFLFEFYFGVARAFVTFQHFSNSVRDCVISCELSIFASHRWAERRTLKVGVTRTKDLGLCWVAPDKALLNSAMLADWLLEQMLAIDDCR